MYLKSCKKKQCLGVEVAMAYKAKILCDSLSPAGVRLTTFEVTFPRIVLAEFNTHRTFSRNSASSRAIPVEKMLKKVKEDPFIPIYWGKNQKGMQAEQELTEEEQKDTQYQWLAARDEVIFRVEELLLIGAHKQIANRLLEPWLWHTVLVTATEWDNFWGLRCNKDAQPEIRKIADMMKELYDAGVPKQLKEGQWHLPLIGEEEVWSSDGITFFGLEDIIKVCVGRCCRVSYLTHDGKRDPRADVDLCEKLLKSGHMSPFEHAARPMTLNDAQEIVMHQLKTCGTFPPSVDPKNVFCGNFRGWVQARKHIQDEHNFSLVKDADRNFELSTRSE